MTDKPHLLTLVPFSPFDYSERDELYKLRAAALKKVLHLSTLTFPPPTPLSPSLLPLHSHLPSSHLHSHLPTSTLTFPPPTSTLTFPPPTSTLTFPPPLSPSLLPPPLSPSHLHSHLPSSHLHSHLPTSTLTIPSLQEEALLAAELEKLERERNLHIRELKRIASEETSR